MEDVLGNDDLRRYIFSFLRRYPQKQCSVCKAVCVWDRRVKYYMEDPGDTTVSCVDCWYENYYHRVACTVS